MTQRKGKVCSQTVATPGERYNVRRVSLVYVEAGEGHLRGPAIFK